MRFRARVRDRVRARVRVRVRVRVRNINWLLQKRGRRGILTGRWERRNIQRIPFPTFPFSFPSAPSLVRNRQLRRSHPVPGQPEDDTVVIEPRRLPELLPSEDREGRTEVERVELPAGSPDPAPHLNEQGRVRVRVRVRFRVRVRVRVLAPTIAPNLALWDADNANNGKRA